MKFSSTVDSLSKENGFLRTMAKILILANMLLSLAVLFLHDKEPAVVERSSRGLEIVRMTPLKRTEQDVEQALKLMLNSRFDSVAAAPDVFISKRQMELREAEQREMRSRGLTQNTVFKKATVAKDAATIDFDRVLAIGEIRSALKTVIKVTFEETEPTELNPYGLKLNDAVAVDSKEVRR